MLEEETSDRETMDALSNSISKSNNSLKSLLRSGEAIKGKNGANYQRHGSFCINSLGLPAEDIGVSEEMPALLELKNGFFFYLLSFRKTFKIILSFPVTITNIGSFTNLE